jgi:hypothetical protein
MLVRFIHVAGISSALHFIEDDITLTGLNHRKRLVYLTEIEMMLFQFLSK